MIGPLAGKRWFMPDAEGWHPKLYEAWFVRNPMQAAVRASEEATVIATLSRVVTPGQRVLEIGCGTGHYTSWLGRAGLDIIAIDPSDAMLAYTTELVQRDGLTSVSTRWGRLPDHLPAGQFDHVVAIGVLNYVADLDAALAAIADALGTGATAVFTVPLRSFGGRTYAAGELLSRRRVRTCPPEEVHQRAEAVGLDVVSQTPVGLSRTGFNNVVEARKGP